MKETQRHPLTVFRFPILSCSFVSKLTIRTACSIKTATSWFHPKPCLSVHCLTVPDDLALSVSLNVDPSCTTINLSTSPTSPAPAPCVSCLKNSPPFCAFLGCWMAPFVTTPPAPRKPERGRMELQCPSGEQVTRVNRGTACWVWRWDLKVQAQWWITTSRLNKQQEKEMDVARNRQRERWKGV